MSAKNQPKIGDYAFVETVGDLWKALSDGKIPSPARPGVGPSLNVVLRACRLKSADDLEDGMRMLIGEMSVKIGKGRVAVIQMSLEQFCSVLKEHCESGVENNGAVAGPGRVRSCCAGGKPGDCQKAAGVSDRKMTWMEWVFGLFSRR